MKVATVSAMRLLGLIVLATGVTGPVAAGKRVATSDAPAARVSAMRSGSVQTRDGLQFTLNADTGSVRIFTDASGEVRYAVRVEAEGSDPSAAALLKRFSLDARGTASGVTLNGRMRKAGDSGRVFVSYEVHLPRRYSLAINTHVGDIVTQDIDGQVTLTTGAGNIQAGRIGAGRSVTAHPDTSAPAARLDTGGGHILVGDVAVGLRASTTGGHITVGNVGGDAVLHTDGGHIQVGSVDGNAELTTGGGNISVARADSGAVAETTGGRIEFGEAAGAIHARSGGGGVHVARVAGPTVLDSSDGGIFLADVAAPLRASTATGAITAWFAPQFGGNGGSSAAVPGALAASELASGSGDIVVYLPREIALTIDAQIEQGSPHRIVADPALPVKVRYQQPSSGHALHALAAFNGGGPVVHLKTDAGDIQLRFLDADIERQLAAQQMASAQRGLAAQKALLMEMQRQAASVFGDASLAPQVQPEADADSSKASAVQGTEAGGGLTVFERLFEGFWYGGLRVDPAEQQNRLQHAVRPAYPEAARQAGLEGDVTLRLVIGPDGAVKDVRAVAGDSELARASIEAVSQWQYAPALLDGRPISVVTTVTLAFRLQ